MEVVKAFSCFAHVVHSVDHSKGKNNQTGVTCLFLWATTENTVLSWCL